MVSLLILKQLHDLGDETVVERWVENPYFQYFSGMVTFQRVKPIDPTDLVYFRKRIGVAGAELIFKVSIGIHGEDALEDEIVGEKNRGIRKVPVQEKAVT